MAGSCKGTININETRVDYEFRVLGPQNQEVQLNLKFFKVPVEGYLAFLAMLYCTHYIANDFGIRLDLQEDKPRLPDVDEEPDTDEGDKH